MFLGLCLVLEISVSKMCAQKEEMIQFSTHLPQTSARTRRNVRALKKLQMSTINLETEYFRRLHELDKEFQPRFNKLQEERRAIVTGTKEPADEETDIALLHGADKEELSKLEEAWNNNNPSNDERGITDFWLLVLLSFEPTRDMIADADLDVLAHLNDITCDVDSNPSSFTLSFHFDKNEYFTNSILEKRYVLSENVDPEDPFSYEGLSIVECTGSQIEWENERNVTKKVIKKKLRNSRTGKTKMVYKTVKTDSFFNFFEPPNPALFAEDDEAVYEFLMSDFEIGLQIREQVIPRAVLYYTGELADKYSDDEYDISLADSDGSEEERVWRERKAREKKRSLPTRPSGFWLFANSLFGESVTRKKDYQGLNRVFLTATFGKLRTKMIECAQPLWNKMSEEEKKVWQKRAQSVKLVAGTSAAEKNRKGKKVPKTLPSEDEDEDFFDGEVDEFDIGAVQVERETSGPAVDSRSKTKRDSDAEKICLWLRSFGQKHLADVKRARFLFASVQTYGDLDRKVIPAEIALVEFSLRHGILDLYSTVIGPWDVPNDVLRFRANFNCKETHKIPLDLKTMLKMGIKFAHKKDVIGEILGRVEPLVAQNQGLKVGLYREGVFEFDDEFEIRSSTLRDGKIKAATVVQHLSDTKPILPGNDAEHRWIVCLDHELDWVVRAMEHLKSDTGLEYEHFPTAPDRFVSVSAFVDAFKRHVQEDAKAIDYANLFASLGTPKFGDEETSTPSEANNRLFCPFHRKVLNPCCASMAACRACFGIFSTLKDAYDLDLIN
ncbi:hypothetical protein QR680_019155 [Steinernema hermaphroditum]|uniref:Maelstrom domain-containing protein n=1 Tax=Steinernema hermaphroditum TaxID=289476 RepID=A0AA39LS75_9BILA|nr:hypothetical protein QR680_019155 [Steinernema hermaphroditum]